MILVVLDILFENFMTFGKENLLKLIYVEFNSPFKKYVSVDFLIIALKFIK